MPINDIKKRDIHTSHEHYNKNRVGYVPSKYDQFNHRRKSHTRESFDNDHSHQYQPQNQNRPPLTRISSEKAHFKLGGDHGATGNENRARESQEVIK